MLKNTEIVNLTQAKSLAKLDIKTVKTFNRNILGGTKMSRKFPHNLDDFTIFLHMKYHGCVLIACTYLKAYITILQLLNLI